MWIKRLFRFFLRHFYYSKDGIPIKCQHCGSKRFGIRCAAFIEGTSCEEYTLCMDCGRDVAFWAYGSYDPAYRENIFNDKLR